MKRPKLKKPTHDKADPVGIPLAATGVRPPTDDNIYVFDDDDADARAFDAFYNAYDDVHDKTRKFLLD